MTRDPMIHTYFSKKDIHQIIARGQTPETVLSQIEIFKRGIPYTTLHRPCTVDDGITVLQQSDIEAWGTLYVQAVSAGRVTKFVPASGAATRMFQVLLSYCEHKEAADSNVLHFINNIQRFAFYDDLQAAVHRHGGEVETYLAHGQYAELLAYLLTSQGLNYANLPKILLKFHRYDDHCRTPLEEHLVEAAAYAQDRHQVARLHVTVTPAHAEAVQAHIEASRGRYERAGLRYEITLSVQSPAADTIAVDLDNNPFRDEQGHLLFRPGGHGALLANLQALAADIVFIKNIDNVVPDHLREVTYRYKRALGGHLVHIQQQMFAYLEHLTAGRVDEGLLGEILTFARQELAIVVPPGLQRASRHEQIRFLHDQLNRPLRVCGMVRNEGEPGGGPFWVEHPDGSLSRQIVEASQVDTALPEQRALLAASTHFNPVDLVCGVRDYRGQPFDLQHFTDPNTGFISPKTYAGRPLKALELPGLWNGAMAYWNTVFVEVPLSTFSPVKTVLDLLRPEHTP
ncbi:MAG TPA: DUF4301 family protein [Candidatus Saccharimonadia bacterium]|nr:DUF4301 family protein [Candidatus Saccharimonadia bacterium]